MSLTHTRVLVQQVGVEMEVEVEVEVSQGWHKAIT
jgi:hypothetical protein